MSNEIDWARIDREMLVSWDESALGWFHVSLDENDQLEYEPLVRFRYDQDRLQCVIDFYNRQLNPYILKSPEGVFVMPYLALTSRSHDWHQTTKEKVHKMLLTE